MVSRRSLLIIGAAACVFAAYSGVSITMGSVARWVEVNRDGHLWHREEWLQLFGAQNFVARGRGRILLSGSSETREDFLFDEIEAELSGFEVYNNAYSDHTLTTLLLVLQYIESVYGASAMPEKILLGVTPRFALNDPPIAASYLPRVIDRYSPLVSVDVESQPPRLIPKGWFDSLKSRYRYVAHQSRRYRGALRGITREAVVGLAPSLADQDWFRDRLAPSWYHHLPPIDQEEQLEELRRAGRLAPDPLGRGDRLRLEWARLEDLSIEHDMELYVVNMPQSTLMVEDYYRDYYDDYMRLLRRVVGVTPFLDLSRFLRDDEFHDLTHANLEAARRVSRRVARFVRAADAMKLAAGQ